MRDLCSGHTLGGLKLSHFPLVALVPLKDLVLLSTPQNHTLHRSTKLKFWYDVISYSNFINPLSLCVIYVQGTP